LPTPPLIFEAITDHVYFYMDRIAADCEFSKAASIGMHFLGDWPRPNAASGRRLRKIGMSDKDNRQIRSVGSMRTIMRPIRVQLPLAPDPYPQFRRPCGTPRAPYSPTRLPASILGHIPAIAGMAPAPHDARA